MNIFDNDRDQALRCLSCELCIIILTLLKGDTAGLLSLMDYLGSMEVIERTASENGCSIHLRHVQSKYSFV